MPSLYETTAIVGDVSSSNFTTLYNSSGLSAPNSGGGGITGNLNVAGNLTVQGVSLLQGAVTLGSTLSTPNYTFPLPDGTTDQVLVTDGSGNLYWTNVSAIPGAAYSIEANTATGGANLTLVDSAGGTDSVKFAGGTNITVSRTDGNTITISTVADNIPDGTANGQLLVWENSAWTATPTVVFDTNSANRPRFVNNITSPSGVTAAEFLKQYTGTLADGAQVGNFWGFWDGVDVTSNSNFVMTHRGNSEYDSGGNSIFRIQTDPVGNFAIASTTIYNQLQVDNNYLGLYGNRILLNQTETGTPTENGILEIERGTSTNATLTWDESQDRWEFNNALEVQGQITGTTNLDLNGDTIVLRSGSATQGNAQIIVNRGASPDARLTWNDTQDRWEFNESLFGSTTSESPAQFERKVASAEINTPNETKGALRLTERVTDAVSNATDQGGPAILFSRASGTTPGSAEATFANISSRYYGTTNTADINLFWSNDNFSEPTPGSFPGTYTLMSAGSNDTKFANDSLFLNYSALGASSIATSITGGNTLVFGSAHGFVAGERIYYTSATQNGLTQNTYYYVLSAGLTTTQCRIGLTATGSAVALTNGAGLSLTFRELINRVGVNTNTPAYTLDVDGDLRATGNVITGGITAGNVTVGVATDNTISTTSGNLDITAVSAATVNITSSLSANPVIIVRETTATNSGVRALTLRTASTGTPAAGLGASLDYEVETAANTYTRAGFVEILATDVTPGSEDFVMNFGVGAAGTFATRATLDGTGTLTLNNDLAVNGGDVTTTSTTGNLFNTNATTVNIGNSATTEVNLGSVISGRVQVKSPELDLNGGTLTFLSEVTGAPALNAQMVVERGTSPDVSIRWNETTDRWQDTTDGTNYFNLPNQNLDTTDSVNFSAVTLDGRTTTDTASLTTTSTSTVALEVTGRNVMKILVNIVQGANVHCVEALVLRTGATAMLTTYGELYNTTPLATFTADVSGGNIRLLVTPTSSTSTVFTTVRTSLT